MKSCNSISLFYCLILLILLFSGCYKDNSEESKENITYRLIGDISSDSLGAFDLWLQDMGTRFAPADNHRDVAIKIKNRFIDMGYQDTKIDSFEITKDFIAHDSIYHFQGWQYNVVATLKGKTYPDSVCILGAHYDSMNGKGDPFTLAPGADDNAAGVSAVFEIARVIKKNKYAPYLTLEFIAFDSEELGLLGSEAYADKALKSHKIIKFILNNDMIAYEPNNDETTWRVNIMDYDNSISLRNKAELLCKKYTNLMPYNFNGDNGGNECTDSYSFFLNGYLAVCFTSDIFDPDYHSDRDLASHCNFDYCKEIVKINCAILVDQN